MAPKLNNLFSVAIFFNLSIFCFCLALRSVRNGDRSHHAILGLLLRSKIYILAPNVVLLRTTKYNLYHSQRREVLRVRKQVSENFNWYLTGLTLRSTVGCELRMKCRKLSNHWMVRYWHPHLYCKDTEPLYHFCMYSLVSHFFPVYK